MFCSPEIRRPKTEGRNPKEGRNPNSEFREWPDSIGGCSAGVAINSDLGLRVSFGLRVSGWEWPGPTSEQPWGRGEGELSSRCFHGVGSSEPDTLDTPHPGGMNENSLRFKAGTGGQRMSSPLTRLFHRGAKGMVCGVAALAGETGVRHESRSISSRVQGTTRCRLKPGLQTLHQGLVCYRTASSLISSGMGQECPMPLGIGT